MRYHVFEIAVGRGSVTRAYVADEGQGRDAAERKLTRTQRKKLLGYHLAVPTSERRREAEDAGLPFPNTAKQRKQARIGEYRDVT